MYAQEIAEMAGMAAEKIRHQRRSLAAHLVRPALAGMYVGAAIVLILVVGSSVADHWPRLVKPAMGICFGGALTIVYFAGSELFTGTNLVQPLGVLSSRTRIGELLSNWTCTWIGNCLGATALAIMVARSGVLSSDHTRHFVLQYAQTKMTLAPEPLFWRAVLANWLVCLGVWMSGRIKSETAKIVMIWWCMFTFITCSFEHSVANMCGLMLGLLLKHETWTGITWTGYAYNPSLATLGNVVGGAVLVGGMYWLGSPSASRSHGVRGNDRIAAAESRTVEALAN